MGDPIETAPKDGTIIRLRNPQMEFWVLGRWGDFYTEWSDKPYLTWVSVFTEISDTDWFPAGRLICPTEWEPQPGGQSDD